MMIGGAKITLARNEQNAGHSVCAFGSGYEVSTQKSLQQGETLERLSEHGNHSDTSPATSLVGPTTQQLSLPHTRPVSTNNAVASPLTNKPTRIADYSERQRIRVEPRVPTSFSGASIRRVQRQHGRSGSQLHASTTTKRKLGKIQREFWSVPVWHEHECFLCGLSRGMRSGGNASHRTRLTRYGQAPIPQSFARHKDDVPTQLQNSPFRERTPADPEATFLTTDTSFVENPPTSSKPSSKYSAPPSVMGSRQSMAPGRGAAARGRAGSGIGRGGVARGGAAARAGGGLGRGATRGRGNIR